MRSRAFLLPALILALAPVARAQVFAGDFSTKREPWEQRLAKGDAALVRQEVESFITIQGANASPSNYSDQHALVGAMGLDARACVAMGDWEAALGDLQKAAATADQNFSATEVSFAKLKSEHADKLTLWKGELADAQAKLDQMNAAPGLTEDQMKLKGQLQTFVAEHQASIQHSEEALKSMDTALATLRQEKLDYEASAASWAAFIDKEKADIATAGSVSAYVTERAAQVKADDSKSAEERLPYVERLLKLDPANGDAKRLEALLERKPALAPPAKKTRKAKGK